MPEKSDATSPKQTNKMKIIKSKEIKTKTVILFALLYSLLTNLGDVKQGFIDGFNLVKGEHQIKSIIRK